MYSQKMMNLLLLFRYYDYYYNSEYSGAIREPMTITVTENAQQNIKITFTNFIYPHYEVAHTLHILPSNNALQ